MSTDLIPVFSGTLANEPAQLVNARDLHAFLEVGRDFSTWINERIEEYGFVENQDFGIFPQIGEKSERGRGRPSKNYCLTLDMGKELAMVERNEKGRIIRRYFIECERRLRVVAPEQAHAAAQSVTTILPSEQQTLSEIVQKKAEGVPAEFLGRAKSEIWSRLHRKFRISKYEQLPRAQLADAILYVIQMELRTGGKAIPKEDAPKALPLDIHYPLESAAPPAGERGLSFYAFAQDEDWIDPNWELLMQLKALGYNVDGPIYSHQAKIHIMTAMYNGLVGKAVDSMNVACTILPYAPIYIR